MADRIRGITIEIDGETKGLSKALQGVNKDIKTTQTQLKDIEKLLKLDPHNVTLLGQKMEALGRQIGQTKDKLSQLKSVSDEMERGLKNGTVTTEQYDAWQREIIQTEQELKNLEEELKKVPSASQAAIQKACDDMDSLGQKVSSVGDKIAGIGDALMPVTAGIVAAGSASITAWNEVDEAFDDIIKKTGATGDDLQRLEDIAESIALTIPTDFKTAANAVGEVNTRFDVTGQNLNDLATAFIQFSNLNNTDVVSSVDNVSAMMKAWGMDAKDVTSVLDLLNGVSQQTGASSQQIADILQSNALSFKELGLDVAQAAVLLGNMEKNGIDASAGITALRHAMSKATDDNKTLNEVMSEWQALMSSNISEAEKMSATEDLFGSRAYAQLFNALQEGTISFTEINASMSDFEGNLSRTFEATLDPADEFTTTLNELKLFGSELGEEILPVLLDVLKDLKPILDDLKEAWESMSEEEQRELIENLGKLALLAPALSTAGRAISGIGHGLSGLAKIGKMLSGLGIGQKLVSLFSGGKELLAGVASALGGSVGSAILAGIGAALGGGAIGKLLDNYVIAPILEYFGSDSASWYKNFKWFGGQGFFAEMFNFSSFQEYWDVAVGTLKLMFDDLKAFVTGYLDLFKRTVTGTLDFISNAWEISINNIKSVASFLADFLPTVWETIKSGVQTAWDTVASIFTNFKDGVFQTFQDIFDKVKEIWDNLGAMFAEGFDIKLPHISVSGGVAPYGIGGKGTLPQFNIDWYANGGILTSPTIFGMQGGHLLGGGEAGAEAVLPLSNLQTMITEGMTQALGNGGDTVINVSIDNNSLGSVILTAQQMMTLRRGK